MLGLQQTISTGNAILVIGTGVSSGVSGGASGTSWVELIRFGAQRVRSLGAGREGWKHAVDTLLELSATGDSSTLVPAASMVSDGLKELGPQAFSDWLAETVGRLEVRDSSLAFALAELRCPILTTNYDALLEEALDRQSAVWSRPAELQRVLSRQSDAIAHLHGVWSEPESVVLSATDYERLRNSQSVQALQQAASSISSLIYVGCGATLADPNIGGLLDWHRRLFSPSAVRHYRLCLDEEVDLLRAFHAQDNIEPVAFGADYGDLVGFIRSVAPAVGPARLTAAGLIRDTVGEAQELLRQDLHMDSLLAELLPSDATESAPVLPPVLLPVPHADYVKARKEEASSARISRIDPHAAATESDVVLLVGEEQAGLTTALRWLARVASQQLGDALPIYIDYQAFQRRDPTPLGRAVGRAAVALGISPEIRDALPPTVLAIDNLTPEPRRLYEAVLSELRSNESVVTYLGCKYGQEKDVLAGLRRVGLAPRVMYLGPLYRQDVLYLVEVVAPSRGPELVEKIMALLQYEHLPRTPFTVSLLIVILLRDGAVAGLTTQAAILDQYVNHMLGMGELYEDARFHMDQQSRAALMAAFAEHLVSLDSQHVEESAAVEHLAHGIQHYGWSESATAVLQNLVERKVLRIESGRVRFSRQSFLALFAARRAMSDDSFRDQLLRQPLRYASVLVLYAALDRADHVLLGVMPSILEQALGAVDVAESRLASPFVELELEPPASARHDLEPAEEEPRHSERLPASEDAEAAIRFEEGLLDAMHPEPEAFPSEDKLGEPLARLLSALELSSQVLRDTDQVADLNLKREVLNQVLSGWGKFIAGLTADSRFQALLDVITEQLERVDDLYLPVEAQADIAEELGRTIPAAIAFGGIDGLLASRRLISVLGEALREGELVESAERMTAAAFLIFAIREPGWSRQLRRLLSDQPNLWILRHFLLWLCLLSYLDDAQSAGNDAEVLELCVDLIERGTKFISSSQRGPFRNQVSQQLSRLKLQQRYRSVAELRHG